MTEISKQIKQRLEEAKARYHCNDNISEYIKEGEIDLLQQEVENKFYDVLQTLVIDTDNDHNAKDTARRVAKMWVKEVFGGRYRPMPKVTSFPNMGYKSMYTSGPISIKSTCAHPFKTL